MLRKIRRFYWYRRDRGQGKQTIMMAVVSVGIVFLMVGLMAKNIVTNHQREQKVSVPQSTVSGSSMTAGPVTEAAISEVETEPKEELPDTQKITVDVTGLNPFLGFMSETAYEEMKNQVTTECQKRGCNRAEKMVYQQTKENGFSVTSFILLSDGSVYQCDYHLKSCAVSLSPTTYTEADIQTMKEKQLQAEQEELEKQQKEAKKKLEKKKNSNKKKVSKKQAKKKSVKKTAKKKSTKK